MSISTSIFTLLSNDEDIVELVDDRIIPTSAKAGTATPYLVFQRISHASEKAHDGAALHQYRYQFSAVSPDQNEAEDIRDALIALLDGYDGTLAGERVTCWHDGDNDGHNEEADLYETMTDFIFTRQT